MRMDKLTTQFQKALADAQSLAVGRDHPHIAPAHVLAALLNDNGSARQLLGNAGANINRLRARLDETLDDLPRVGTPTGEVSVGQDLARVLNLTDKLALSERRREEAEARVLQMGGTVEELKDEHHALLQRATRENREQLAAARKRRRG